jgi:hypothetical protein
MGAKYGTVDPWVFRNLSRSLTPVQDSHIVAETALLEESMRHEAQYGALLLAGSAVLLVMAVVHPSAIPFGDPEALARMTVVDAVAHSLAILGTCLLLAGQVGLSRMLGLQRTVVMAALVASALPAAGIVVAVALDGFVIPKLAEQWMGGDDTARAGLQQLIGFCVLVASSLTRIYMLLVAVAILLWSWVVHRDYLSPGLPWVGGLVGLAGIATLFGGPAYVSVHELLALVVGQSLWMVWAGMLMIRKGGTTVAAADAN